MLELQLENLFRSDYAETLKRGAYLWAQKGVNVELIFRQYTLVAIVF